MILIQAASASDFPCVATLFEALHTYNASLDSRFALAHSWRGMLKDILQQPPEVSLCLLAHQDGRAVGLLLMLAQQGSPLFQHNRWAELAALYVDQTCHRQGIARRLMSAGIAWTQAQGLDCVQLYVTASNLRAKTLYQRYGFQPVQEIWRLDLPTVASPSSDYPFATCEIRQGEQEQAE